MSDSTLFIIVSSDEKFDTVIDGALSATSFQTCLPHLGSRDAYALVFNLWI